MLLHKQNSNFLLILQDMNYKVQNKINKEEEQKNKLKLKSLKYQNKANKIISGRIVSTASKWEINAKE